MQQKEKEDTREAFGQLLTNQQDKDFNIPQQTHQRIDQKTVYYLQGDEINTEGILQQFDGNITK